MNPSLSSLDGPVRDHLLADHRRMDDLLDRLMSALEANARADAQRLWTDLETNLMAHMATEEQFLFPRLVDDCERDAQALAQEHKHIRARLAELGAALELHVLRLEAARSFAEDLKAHARHEDKLLYRWAEGRLPEPERASLLASLIANLQRLGDGGRASPAASVKGL